LHDLVGGHGGAPNDAGIDGTSLAGRKSVLNS
jgi:hypothetical protein